MNSFLYQTLDDIWMLAFFHDQFLKFHYEDKDKCGL